MIHTFIQGSAMLPAVVRGVYGISEGGPSRRDLQRARFFPSM
jgi:hypothetical protein